MITTSGLEISVDGRSRQYVDVATVRRSIALMLKHMDVPAHQAADVLRVNRATYFRMLSNRSAVPKPQGVVFGSGEWTPAVEDQDMRTCDRCGGDGGTIKKGSRLYCAACHRTGFEKRLEKERIDDIFQEAIAAECESQERKAELAQRRKKRKK